MSLQDKIKTDIKKAMIAGQKDKVSVLRMLDSALKNEMISLKKRDEGLTDDETVSIIKREVKKRKDSSSQYSDAGRQDLADQEELEIGILSVYLPEQMGVDDLRSIVEKICSENEDNNFGQIMKLVMAEVGNKADGRMVSDVVKQVLA